MASHRYQHPCEVITNEVQLEAMKAYPNDSGRGITHLDPDTLLHLRPSPGDTIEIGEGEATATKVWRTDRQDRNADTVRIGGLTRQNINVGIDERVTIRKAGATKADKFVLAPPEETSVQFGSDTADMVKRQILRRPVVRRDIVPVMPSTNHPFIWSPGQAIPLIAVETKPEGVVSVTKDTDVGLRKEPISGFEKAGGGIAYEDTGGPTNETQRVREMIELPMKYPQMFKKLGIKPPRRMLLRSPPDTGKTLLVRAVANKTSASFFSITGPKIILKYYGRSEQQLREILEDAKEESPSIIFIDKLDSIAPKREDVTGEAGRRVVAQLLTTMNGLEVRGQVIVIATTNRVDLVDPAPRRPDRFDCKTEIGVPDGEGRKEIFQIRTRGISLSDSVNPDDLTDGTHGFVGAGIEALTKEAAMKALRHCLPGIDLDRENVPPSLIGRMVIKNDDFGGALDEVEPSAMREVLVEIPKVAWSDVGGLEGPKQEVQESVEWPLTTPKKFQRMSTKAPKDVLLYGPPGTGETLIAKAVANEANANFTSVRDPQLLSKWVGEPEKAIRQTFHKARQVSLTIIFFDELDAFARACGNDMGNSVPERVVNQLLTELDGLEDAGSAMVIAATNRPDMIDPALVCSGRFSRLMFIDQPEEEGREQILDTHTQQSPLAPDMSLREIAEIIDGYVGSGLESVRHEVAIEALRGDSNIEEIEVRHFRKAMGSIRPITTEGLTRYYEDIQDQFKGGSREGLSPDTRDGSRIGFQ